MTLAFITDPAASWNTFVADPARYLLAQIVRYLPLALGALIIFVIWLIAAVIARIIVRKLLTLSKADRLIQGTKIARLVQAIGTDASLARLLGQLTFWTLIIVGFAAAADVLGLEAVREILSGVAAFIPKLFSALIALVLGAWLAALVARAVGGLARETSSPFASLIEKTTEFVLLLVVITISLDLLGADLTILHANITILIGSGFVTLAFLAGWALRRPAEQIVSNYYLRRILSVGDTISHKGQSGTIEKFSALGFVLQTQDGSRHLVLAKEFLSEAKWKSA